MIKKLLKSEISYLPLVLVRVTEQFRFPEAYKTIENLWKKKWPFLDCFFLPVFSVGKTVRTSILPKRLSCTFEFRIKIE